MSSVGEAAEGAEYLEDCPPSMSQTGSALPEESAEEGGEIVLAVCDYSNRLGFAYLKLSSPEVLFVGEAHSNNVRWRSDCDLSFESLLCKDFPCFPT